MGTRGAALAVAVLVALGSWPAQSQAAEATAAPRVFERQADGGVYVVEGRFEVRRPVATVWSVLTDYEGFPRFVHSLDESNVRSRRADAVVIEQRAQAKAFVFTRTLRVLLEVREALHRKLQFRDVSHRDFELYEGSWTLTPKGEGVEVTYQLRAKPKSAVPSFIGDGAVRENAAALLAEVRAEILRR